MKKQKSCGAVVFSQKSGGKREYLLIQHSDGGHWAFPKGRMEEGESEKQTAVRETEEETGINDLIFIDGFREEIRYTAKYNEIKVSKTAILFIAKTNTLDIKLSDEHTDFRWREFKEAMDLLTYDDTKQILKKADDFLKNKIG